MSTGCSGQQQQHRQQPTEAETEGLSRILMDACFLFQMNNVRNSGAGLLFFAYFKSKNNFFHLVMNTACQNQV